MTGGACLSCARAWPAATCTPCGGSCPKIGAGRGHEPGNHWLWAGRPQAGRHPGPAQPDRLRRRPSRAGRPARRGTRGLRTRDRACQAPLANRRRRRPGMHHPRFPRPTHHGSAGGRQARAGREARGADSRRAAARPGGGRPRWAGGEGRLQPPLPSRAAQGARAVRRRRYQRADVHPCALRPWRPARLRAGVASQQGPRRRRRAARSGQPSDRSRPLVRRRLLRCGGPRSHLLLAHAGRRQRLPVPAHGYGRHCLVARQLDRMEEPVLVRGLWPHREAAGGWPGRQLRPRATDLLPYAAGDGPARDDHVRVPARGSLLGGRAGGFRRRHRAAARALRLLAMSGRSLEIASMADIPAGTGLGSSGSFTTALLKALHAYKNQVVHPRDLAEEACHIEIDLLLEEIGKQDQYISAFGGVTCFEFQPDGEVAVQPLTLSSEALYNLEDNLLLFFTGYSRSASEVLHDQNRRTLDNDGEVARNLTELKDMAYATRRALEGGDFGVFARLLSDQWQQKKRRSGAASNGKIDQWYALGVANGALGGKLVGAGGGGFLMFYAEDRVRLRRAMLDAGLPEV